MIGRLEPRKNYHLALAAFKIAKTLRPDLNVIIGDGPLRRDLHRTIERLGLQDVEINPTPQKKRSTSYWPRQRPSCT